MWDRKRASISAELIAPSGGSRRSLIAFSTAIKLRHIIAQEKGYVRWRRRVTSERLAGWTALTLRGAAASLIIGGITAKRRDAVSQDRSSA